MKVLVICRPAPDADHAQFAALVSREGAALRDLKQAGILLDAWSPGGPGAVLMLEATDEREATSLVAELPLASSGLITTELIPLHTMSI